MLATIESDEVRDVLRTMMSTMLRGSVPDAPQDFDTRAGQASAAARLAIDAARSGRPDDATAALEDLPRALRPPVRLAIARARHDGGDVATSEARAALADLEIGDGAPGIGVLPTPRHTAEQWAVHDAFAVLGFRPVFDWATGHTDPSIRLNALLHLGSIQRR